MRDTIVAVRVSEYSRVVCRSGEMHIDCSRVLAIMHLYGLLHRSSTVGRSESMLAAINSAERSVGGDEMFLGIGLDHYRRQIGPCSPEARPVKSTA